MANTGGGSAYVRLQRLEDNVPQTQQFWGGLQAKENEAAKAAKLAADKLKADQDKEAFERYSIDPSKYKVEDAGFSDINSDNINYANQRVQIGTDYMRQAQEAYAKGDRVAAEGFRNKALANQAKFSARMATMKSANKSFEDLQKLVLEGKSSGYNRGMENGYKATSLKGGKVMTMVGKDDEDVTRTSWTDEKGQEHVQYISATDINSGAFRAFTKQNPDEDVRKIAKSIQGTERRGINGMTLTHTLLWDKTTEASARAAIKTLIGSTDYMADMVDQMNLYGTKGFENIPRDNPPAVPKFTDAQRKVVEERLMAQVEGQFKQINERTPNVTAMNIAAQEKARQENREYAPKTPAQIKELANGIRKNNIMEVRDNGVVSFFNSGNFKWQGQDLVSKGAKLVGNNIVIQTDSGPVTVPTTNDVTLNELFNSFAGKNEQLSSETVQAAKPVKWREFDKGGENYITDMLGGETANGIFTGDETTVKTKLQELFPDAKIEETGTGDELLINGYHLSLGDVDRRKLEAQIRNAVGIKPTKRVKANDKAQAPRTISTGSGGGGGKTSSLTASSTITRPVQPTASDPLGLGI